MGSSDITNVYAALDRTHTVVALERSRRGDEGFRTFFDEFADYAANKGYIPYLLLLNFHVDDGSRLPPIEAKERGYRLAHLAPLEVKDIRQALTLYDLLYCRKHGLDPLAAQNTARNLCYKDDYAGFRNESIPALSQPGAPYRAVETEGGVALFRRGERGDEAARSFFAFLTAHPDGRGLTCGVETLRIYDVELSEEQYSSEACLPYFDHEQMRFVPRHSGRCDSVLQRGCCLKEYDMRAGAAKLAAAPDSGTEASSEALRRLLTIVTLRHIARNGYEPFCWGGSDFPGYDFPFADRFKNADRKPAAAMPHDGGRHPAHLLRHRSGKGGAAVSAAERRHSLLQGFSLYRPAVPTREAVGALRTRQGQKRDALSHSQTLMTMEQDQEQMQGALYVAVDDGNKIIAMERSRRGDEGFRALLDEFTDYAANCGAIPSVLFFDIRTTDAALLPRIEAAEHSYLLDPSTATEKLDIRHAVTLKDLLYCYKYDLDPLAEGNCGNMLSTKADYRQFRNEGLPPVAREDLRRCRAVETERGAVLFTQEPDGREACERYMQHHADCFFDPDLGVETLRVYEVEADPDGFWDKVNPQVLPTAGGMMWVPEHPFVDAEVLRRGYCLKEYDMRATADNFWAFVDPQHGENLYVSNGIRDLTGLQIIMQRGYGYLMQNAERYWNREFVFRSGFDNIERKYASDLSDEGRAAKREEQYNLAAYILDRKFPIRRRPSSEIPPMQAEGIRTFRNFDAINLLFRPDKLLEAYQRRRDEPVRGTEFHLKRH